MTEEGVEDVLGKLVSLTQKSLETIRNEDDLETITLKMARKKKVDLPATLNSFSPACLAEPLCYPLLLEKERLLALQNPRPKNVCATARHRQH